MLEKVAALGDEGLVTTALATGIALHYADMDVYSAIDAATFGISSAIGERIPGTAQDVLVTAVAIWAGLYLGGQILNKGIDLPLLPEIQFDFPGINSNEGSLF